ADHRLGDVAEYRRVSKVEAAGKNGNQPTVLGVDRHGHDQDHVRVAGTAQERLRDYRLPGSNRILEVRTPREVLTAPASAEGALGKQRALRRHQEHGSVGGRVQPGIAVEVALGSLGRGDVPLGDLDGNTGLYAATDR